MVDDGPIDELHGKAATDFADTHLEETEVDASGWITTYRDPTDGSIWILDYPHGEAHGGGSPRLRRQRDLAVARGSFRNTGPGEDLGCDRGRDCC